MDINYSEIADKIFTTLVGSNFKVEAFDNQGNAELNPEKASRFVSPQLTVNLDRDRQTIWVDIQEESSKNSIIDLLKGIAREHNLDFDYKVFGRAIKPKRESIMTAIESVKPRKLDEVLPALAAGVVGRMAAGAAVRAGAGELGSALTGSAASSAVKSALSPKDLEDVDVDEAHDEDHNDKIYAQMHAIAQNIGDREEVAAERRRKIFHPEDFTDQVKFSVSSDKAQHAVTSRWGEFISQDEEGHFVAPRKIWSKIEQTAHNADGVGAEEIYDTETMQAMKSESSDPSGIFHAAKHLNKKFEVVAEIDEKTRTFQLPAQNGSVARETVLKKFPTAKISSVEDITDKQDKPKVKKQGVAEGQQVNEESHDVYKDYIAMGHSHAEAMRAAREYEDKQKSRDYENYVTKIYINDKHWQKGDNNILGERGAQKAAQHAANIARKTGKRVSIHMIDLANSDTLAIADFDNGKWKYRDLTASATESVTEDSADRTVHISKDDWVPFVDWMESEGLGISEEDGIKHNDLGDVIELVFPPANTSWNNDAAWMYASEWDVRDQNMQEDAQIDEAFKDDLKKLAGVVGLAGAIGTGAYMDHKATYDTPLVHEIVRQAQAGNEGAIKDLHNISLRDGSTVELNRLLNKYGFRSEYERKTPEPTMERSTPVPPPKVGFAKHGRKAKARMPYRSVNQDKYAPAAYDEKKAKTRKDIEDYFYKKEIGETMKKQDVAEGFWQDAVKKAEAEREARKGKPFEKNPASHDKQGVYKGDKDLAGNPVPKRKKQGVAEGYDESMRAAYDKGQEAGKKSWPANNNPYDPKTQPEHHKEWSAGHRGVVPDRSRFMKKQGVAEGSGKNVVKSVKVGNFRHDLVDTGMGWQVRIYNGDELYDTGLSKNSEQKGLAALEDAVAYTEKQTRTKRQGMAEGHADQQRKIFKKNGKPVGEVGIDRESSPGVGQWYMKCYLNGIDNAGYDSYEEAVAELKHCLKQGVAEASKKIPASDKPVKPKDVLVSLKDVPVKKPRGHKQYDPAKDFPGVKAFQKEGVAESKVLEGFGHMLGSTKTSYQPLDGVKIIVRHKSAVSEEVRGSRSRNIKEIFIQRGDERFKMKEASLQAARAMARHVHSGGEVYDQVGKAINEMATEQKALANFVRFVSRSGMVNETNQEYVDLATKRVHAIREAFRKLMGPKTYANAVENINNEVSVELTETDLDLESKFTSISCDKRVTNAVASMQSALARESAFASAIEEAINKEDFGAIKHRLQEQDAIQFENATARLAHQVSQLSGVAQDARLGTYLNNISKKIGEGIELEAFETKTVKLCLERAKCQGGRKKRKMESQDPIKESKAYAEFLEKFDIF